MNIRSSEATGARPAGASGRGQPLRVAVTGGSGQLGTLLVRRLAARADIAEIISLDVRPPVAASTKLRPIRADVRDPEIVRHFRGCDAVIHAAFLVTANLPNSVFRSVNIDGSMNVFTAAAEAGVPTIVHISSIMAYGVVPGHPVPLTEESPRIRQPAFPYAACKFDVEERLDAFERDHPEIAIARIRPGILLGRDIPHVLGWFLRHGVVPNVGPVPLPIVWDEDTADLAILAMIRRARGAFIAMADDLLTAPELAKHANLFWLDLYRVAVGLYDSVNSILKRIGLSLPYSAIWVKALRKSMLVGSSARARAELGWTPGCPTAAAVLDRFLATAPLRLHPTLSRALALIARNGGAGPTALPRPVRLHLSITGRDGGDRTILAAHGRVAFEPGPTEGPSAFVGLSPAQLARLLTGRIAAAGASETGPDGDAEGAIVILEWLAVRFDALCRSPDGDGRAARRLAERLAALAG